MPEKGQSLLDIVKRLLPSGESVRKDAITLAKGAYALLVRLDQPVEIERAQTKGTLPAGWYVYSGSARGSGGIKGRLGRHFKADKPIRWHVDELTVRASAMTALAVPGGCECDIVARLLASGRFEPALPGFGSSDCATCPTHLLVPVE